MVPVKMTELSTRMHWTSIYRSLALTFLIVMVVGATYGRAVEPPRRYSRVSRSHYAPIKVSVNPDHFVLRYGEVIKIKCRARGGVKVEDMPFISFYRKLGPHTILPMSSGFPGVTIETVASGKPRSRHNRAKTYMKLGPEVWRTLYPGNNEFYCKGYKMNGEGKSAYFIVRRE